MHYKHPKRHPPKQLDSQTIFHASLPSLSPVSGLLRAFQEGRNELRKKDKNPLQFLVFTIRSDRYDTRNDTSDSPFPES